MTDQSSALPLSAEEIQQRETKQSEFNHGPRDEKLLRATLSMLCNFIWHRALRPGEHLWSIPVDMERDFDCILSDGITELVQLRATLDAERTLREQTQQQLAEWRQLYLTLREQLAAKDAQLAEVQELLAIVRDDREILAARLRSARPTPEPTSTTDLAKLIGDLEWMADRLDLNGWRALPCRTCDRFVTITVHDLHAVFVRAATALRKSSNGATGLGPESPSGSVSPSVPGHPSGPERVGDSGQLSTPEPTLREALIKVRAHTSYVNPTMELLQGLLQSIERITEAALASVSPPPPGVEMTPRDEAQKVYHNLKGDHRQIAHYVVERCGDFVYDHEREDFIAEFLAASAEHNSPPPQEGREP